MMTMTIITSINVMPARLFRAGRRKPEIWGGRGMGIRT
jgi:hypothetical protein